MASSRPLSCTRLASCLLLAASGLLAGAEPAAPATPAGPPAIRELFRPALLNLPLVNGAGTRLIGVFGNEQDRREALYFDLEKRTMRHLYGPKDRDVVAVEWLDNDHFLAVQIKEKIYADGIYVTDVHDTDHSYAIERRNAVELVSVPRATPMRPIVWIRRDAYNDGADYGAVQLDATTTVDANPTARYTETRILKIGQDALTQYGTEANIIRSFPEQKLGQTVGYMADKEGELAFARTLVQGAEKLLLLRGKKWVPSPVDAEVYDLLAPGDEPNEVIAVGPHQEGKPRAIIRLDADSGAVKGVLYQDDAYDPVVAAVKRHPVTQRIAGLQLYRKGLESVWFDPEFQALQAALNKLFPGRLVSIINTDATIQRVTIAVFSDRQPPVYHFLDRTKNELSVIAESAPWIDAGRMRPTQNVAYKSRDGFKVEGYLTLPAGASKEQPAPMVVLVHGGPWARDLWGFDPEVQFLATRGYAVFQPNYRGSTGFAWRFPESSNWDFTKMHDDVTDGVRQILKSGFIDPRRVAIMGASFGGYLALCGVADEPDLYRCAISEAGVFDWKLMMQDAKRNRFESVRYDIYLRHLGDPARNAGAFEAMSPLARVAGIRAPVLVAHGQEDEVVAIEQSEKLVAQLRAHGIPHQVLFQSGEAHGIFRLDHQVEFYTAVEKFLAEHLGPR